MGTSIEIITYFVFLCGIKSIIKKLITRMIWERIEKIVNPCSFFLPVCPAKDKHYMFVSSFSNNNGGDKLNIISGVFER
jgi:hypothetical protein